MSMTSTVERPAATSPPSKVETWGLIGSVAAAGLVLLVPTPAGLSPEGHRLLALFVGIIALWCTGALPIAVTSLLALGLQPVLGINGIGPAIASFMSPIFFFVLVMFVIALAWVKTGLAQRFALWMITMAGTDARRVVIVFMVGTGSLSMIVSDVPCAAIFMALALGIFERLGLRPGQTNFGRVLMLAIPIAALIGGIGTPAGSSVNLLGLDMIEQSGGERISFLHWMAIGIPMIAVLLPFSAWVLLKCFPPEIETIGDVSSIRDDLARMGPISAAERKTILIMATMVVLWILSTWLPSISIFTVAILGGSVMFLPGVNLFSWREAEESISWSTLMLIGGVTTLGAASGDTGLAAWLAETTLGGVPQWGLVVGIAAISAFTVVIHLALPIAPIINAVMIPPIMAMGTAAGVDGALYALPVIFTASCACLLPLDAVPLVTYAKGYYKFFDMFVPGAIISIAWVIVMTAAMLWIGPLLGLL